MAFLGSLDIAGSALTAERFRSDIISQNIANAKTTITQSGEPYRRQQVIFEEKKMTFQNVLNDAQKNVPSAGVRVSDVVKSDRDFKLVYDPTHPQADEDGYVSYPNVDTTEEMIDLMAASNAYDANLTALSVMKGMISKTLEMKK